MCKSISFSRTVRKQRKFEHRFRGTIRDDPDLKLTSLSRFSAPGKKNNANTNHYVSAIYDPNTLPQITFTSDSVLDPPYHRDDKQIWRFPEQNSLNNQLQRPTSFLEQNKGTVIILYLIGTHLRGTTLSFLFCYSIIKWDHLLKQRICSHRSKFFP